MRRSLAPSQQLRSLVTKKPKFSSHVNDSEKENEDFVNSVETVDPKNTLQETLKSIRKSNVSSNDGEPNDEVASETSVSSPSRNMPLFDSQSNDALYSTRVRNELKDNDSDDSKTSVDTSENNTFQRKPKFVPPKRFISPLLAGQTKDTFNVTSCSGDISVDTDDSIVSRYYSVVW